MERATQDGYITQRSIHQKIIMHQPSSSYASSITQPSWLWSYEHGNSYTIWLHHTPINKRNDYHVTTFMIIRIKHNPIILALELKTWKELRKMVTSNTINTRKDYHASTFMIIRTRLTQPPWRWSYKHGKSYARCLHHTPIKTQKIIMHQPSWSYASSIAQPSWRWSYHHGKSYTRWLHHTPIKTRKDYHASTFMIIRIKHNPTILALELLTWKELHKMVTSHTDQYTKRLSCINLHGHTHQA